MKTKQFCMLLLAMVLFAACEKSGKLSAPSELQGQQMGNAIVLAWNRVDGAISYEVQRNGMYLITTSSTNYTDNNPSNGYNSYEVVSTDGQSRSQAAYVNIFFDGNSSGGDGGGGSNPGGTTVTINQNNLAGYWHGKSLTYSDGSSSSYSDYYINLSNTGLWESVHITASNKCSVSYGTWYLSASSLYVEVKGQNNFENGQCTAQYSDTPRTDLYGVESLTTNTMLYTTGQYPYLKTYEFEKVYSIPVSYKHNSDL